MKIYKYDNYEEYINCQLQHKNTRNRTMSKSYDAYHNLIKKYFPNANKILSIGSRDISEVNSFKNKGYDAIGIDLYTTDVNLIKIIDMHDIDNHFTENQFDIAFSCHSLEHSYDPAKVLKSLKKVTSEGALIVLPSVVSPSKKDPVMFDFMTNKSPSKNEIEAEFSLLIESKIDLAYMSYKPDPFDGYWFVLKWNK